MQLALTNKDGSVSISEVIKTGMEMHLNKGVLTLEFVDQFSNRVQLTMNEEEADDYIDMLTRFE
jgi:hypothetical protein